MTAQKPLWWPGAERVAASRLKRFEAYLREHNQRVFTDYSAMHRWSVEQPAEFWSAVWDFAGVQASRAADAVLLDAECFPGARWFSGARLNYAENRG
jgi:acetoacetyl-CoA synthetase